MIKSMQAAGDVSRGLSFVLSSFGQHSPSLPAVIVHGMMEVFQGSYLSLSHGHKTVRENPYGSVPSELSLLGGPYHAPYRCNANVLYKSLSSAGRQSGGKRPHPGRGGPGSRLAHRIHARGHRPAGTVRNQLRRLFPQCPGHESQPGFDHREDLRYPC